MALDDLLDKVDAALGTPPSDQPPTTAAPDAAPPAGTPDARSFGSMLLGLVPGFGPKGFGPENWAPARYNAADAAVHGATFGLSDIARGGVGDLTGVGPSMADVKADRDTFATEHPYANIGANITGGAATAAALPLGSAFGPAMRVADPFLRRLATVGTSAGVGAAMGGVGGAIDAAPAGGQAALEGAGTGALTGAAVGTAAPTIGYGVGGAVRAIGDRLGWRPALDTLGINRPAGEAVMRGLRSDDAFGGGQGAQNIARAGPYGMIADAGPTSTGMLDEAISSGGPGALTARNAVNQRAAASNQDLSNALDAALGPAQGIYTTRAGIRTTSAPFRSAAYDTAYGKPIDYSTPEGAQLTELLSRVPQRAVAHANEMMVGQGQAPGRMVTTVNPDGTLSFATPPTVRQIDYLTRGLRQISTEAEGALGGSTEASSTWQGLSGDIRSTLGGPRGNRGTGMVPEYGQALDTAADPISQSQAVQFGGDILKKNLPRDVVEARVGHMSQAELEAARQGIRSHIDELVANVNNAASNPSYDAAQLLAQLKNLNSQAAREKLGMIMDPVQLASLNKQLETATSSAQLYANTTRNSATAGRIATREAVAQATEPGALGQVARMQPVQASKRAGQLVTGYTPQYTQQLSDMTRGQIADLLTRRVDPATGRSGVIDALEGILPALARSSARGQAVERALPSIVLPPGVQGARQSLEGPPVPPGVFPPRGNSGGGIPPPVDPYAGEVEQSRHFAANGAPDATVAPPAAPQQYTVPGSAPRDLSPVPDTGQGTWWNNALGAAGDIGTAAAGLAERFNKGALNTLGLRSPGSDIYRADIPVAPGLERAGDVATFLTGGLANSLFPAPGAFRAAGGYAAPAARSLARTAGELAADEAGAVRLPGRLGRGTPITMPPSVEEAAAGAPAARAAEEPGFGPIYHRTTADIENLNQVDLSKASPSARLGPAVYGSLEGGPEWNPAGMGGKVLSGRVKGDIIDLTKPLPAADQARLEDVVGRTIPEGAHELALERKFGSVAAGLKEAGYTGALHEGPGSTGTHVAVFDPANIIPEKTPVPEGVQAPGVAATAPAPVGTRPPEAAPAAAAEAPAPAGVMPPEEPPPGIGHNMPPPPRFSTPGARGSNPLAIPVDAEAKLARKLKRDDPTIGAPNNEEPILLPNGVHVGPVDTAQWINRTEKMLPGNEIDRAAQWYEEALPSYEKYFGKDRAPAMMGAWLIANQNATPGFAQLSATRALEQYIGGTKGAKGSLQAGLPADKLEQYWDAILSGDTSKFADLKTGQKIHDFIDSAVGKDTRTFYGDDPRAGRPAVADVHTNRDTGTIDPPLLKWIRQKFGDDVADGIKADPESSPSETKYEWSADRIRKITDDLNDMKYRGRDDWKPHQVQAVGWKAMSQMLGRPGQTAEDAIASTKRYLSYELDFGKGAPWHKTFPEWKTLTPAEKAEISPPVIEKAMQIAKDITGAHESWRLAGTGAWKADINPAFRSEFLSSPEVVSDVASILGHQLQQTAVYGMRFIPSGKKLAVAVHGPGLDNETALRALWQEIHTAHPDLAGGFTPAQDANGVPGLHIGFDSGGKVLEARIKKELLPTIEAAANKLGFTDDFRAKVYKAETAEPTNNWTRNRSGESHLRRLSARYGPDVRQRLEDHARTELEPLIRQEIDRVIAKRGNGSSAAAAPEASGQKASSSVDPKKILSLGGLGLGLGLTGQSGFLPGEMGR